MNKETYEALKRVIDRANWVDRERMIVSFPQDDVIKVETWIDEVSKEYQEGGEQE